MKKFTLFLSAMLFSLMSLATEVTVSNLCSSQWMERCYAV